MTDEHADRIIELLESILDELQEIKSELSSVESNVSLIGTNTFDLDEKFNALIKAVKSLK